MLRTCSTLALLFGVYRLTRPSLADERGLEFFEAKIRPVLVERCNRCHSDGKKAPKGGLRLDSPDGLLKGGDSGVAIVPRKVDESPLIDAIAHEGDVAEMPPDSKLPERVIADFRHRVEIGAPLPESRGAAASPPRSAIDPDKGRQFRSFLTAAERTTPTVSDPRWSRNRIDPFILRGLDEHGMRPSPEPGGVGLVRARDGEPEPARLRLPGKHLHAHGEERLPPRRAPGDSDRSRPAESRPDDPASPQREARSGRQAWQLDFLREANAAHLADRGEDALLEARIRSMETAFRMQAAAPEVFDIRKEDAATRALYGEGKFASTCLLARRLAENGVRMVQVVNGDRDHHSGINKSIRRKCKEIDRPIAGLLTDLKRRGLLEDTLVIWGGEFGRTPVSENGDGRDHNPFGFTMWMAGGGVKGGLVHGATDEFGFRAVEGRVGVHDLHATILHLLGLDHEKLTYRYSRPGLPADRRLGRGGQGGPQIMSPGRRFSRRVEDGRLMSRTRQPASIAPPHACLRPVDVELPTPRPGETAEKKLAAIAGRPRPGSPFSRPKSSPSFGSPRSRPRLHEDGGLSPRPDPAAGREVRRQEAHPGDPGLTDLRFA